MTVAAVPGANGVLPLSLYSQSEIGTDPATQQTIQGEDGTLFFAGRALLSFDGERWQADALSTAGMLRGIDLGPDGRIWAVATTDLGWFDLMPDGRRRFHSLAAHIDPREGPIVFDNQDHPAIRLQSVAVVIVVVW